MKHLTVSIIIPAYNAEEYIGKCIESVLKQSWQDFEILVLDDGSKDKTGQIVKEYVKKDERVKYIKQQNMGVARTRNKGVKMARGEYIAFIDNDDFIDTDYLETLLPKDDTEIMVSGFKRPDESGKIVAKMRLRDTEWSKFMNPTPWAKIYRRDFIVDNKIEFLDNNIGEDIYFNLVAMLTAKKVQILDYVGYNWFYNRKSISNTEHKDFEKIEVFKLLNSCYDELKKRDLIEQNYQLVEFFFLRFIVWFLLYSSKGQKKQKIDVMYNKLFDWLKQRFPDYRKNELLKMGKLPGEARSTRMIYEVFMKCHKVGISKSLIRVYARF